MASRAKRDWEEITFGEVPDLDPLDPLFDLDALAGEWFAASADPHYAELPCYVPLDNDDDFGPFGDEPADDG